MFWSKVDILAYTKPKGDRLRWLAHAGLLAVMLSGPSELLWVTAIVYFWFSSIGIFVGQHRYFTHRCFNTSKLWERILMVSGTLASLTSVFGYIIKHREHHKASDSDSDPHSPHHMSLWKSWTLGLKDDQYDLRLAKDWIRNEALLHTHKYFFGYILVYVFLLALVNPWLVLYGYLAPVSLCVWATGAFNTWGHGKGLTWMGYRTYDTDDKSTNHWLVNIITFGEGWHNNHHNDPSLAYQGNKWWEWDLNGLIIKVISK